MSLDLIKKQKANIRKERRKVAESNDFRFHPLAYQPVPKGKEGATKEQINKDKKKSALDSFCSFKNKPLNCSQISPKGLRNWLENKINKYPLKKTGASLKTYSHAKDFKMTPDKNAVNLFLSKMHPTATGKKGGHVSDVLIPNEPPFRKNIPERKIRKVNDLDFQKNSALEKQSYLGYKGTANLEITINHPARIPIPGKKRNENPLNRTDVFLQKRAKKIDNLYPIKDPIKEEIGLKNRLGDLEVDLPQYSDEDIFSLEGKVPYETQQKNLPDQNEKKDNIAKKIDLPKNFDPYGTTVKLSFVKPQKNLKVEIKEESDPELGPNLSFDTIANTNQNQPAPFGSFFFSEPALNMATVEVEEEEEPLQNQIFSAPSKSYPTATQNTRSLIDLRNKNKINISVAEDEEENPSRILSDYKPVPNYQLSPLEKKKFENKSFLEKPNHLQKKIEKFWNHIKKKSLIQRKPVKILNFQFHSGRECTINPSKPLKPKKNRQIPAWSKKFFTKEEEKLIQKLKLNDKFFRLKGKFFVFRSGNAKRSAAMLAIGIFLALTIPIGAYVQKVIEAKNRIEVKSNEAYDEVQSAKSAIISAKPEEARRNFETAYKDFLFADESLNEVGGGMLTIIKVLPGGSKIESGQNILEAGKHLASAGQIMSEAFALFLGEQGALKKNLASKDNLLSLKEATAYIPPEHQDKAQTLTEAIILFKDKLEKSKGELASASESLDKVNIKDVPEDKRESFLQLKDQLPKAVSGINNFSEYSNIILNVLGHSQPKQYLFVFENNDEIRATGGFIGTYGIMKINEGNISQLTIDGIYNPDGQLKERVIPPKPIQKMSATWSMHDANWWPDFPKSAEKIAWFYEKTGGPTVDGVIAFTPKIMEDLLKITGPINHEKYGVVVNADNFVEVSQYKVEKDYDKQLNRPKQFLADLAPILLEKIFNAPPEKWIEILNVFSANLEEREIQMYFFDYNVQKKVSDLGWSGEILDTPKDFLSVINTNISGLKTDRMIEQKINHSAEIKSDGSIVDTVTVTRTHHGGKEKYDWYNAVNSDWMRIYVPKGSELLSAEGYTREVNSSPVDYTKLGFIEDEMVVTEESGTNVDPDTGTRVYEDSGKTVFANWTYVSPGETLTIKYSYLLPFKLQFDNLKKPADTYSLLVQKQSGDENSWIDSEVKGLENFDSIYKYPDTLILPNWKIDEKFSKDIFAGAVLAPKGTKLE